MLPHASSDDQPNEKYSSARLLKLQEEVRCMQERKVEELTKMAEDTGWRESVKMQMEAELERRVREALDTPPLERMQRARDNARRRAQEEERSRLSNSHLRFDFTERDRAWLRQRRLRLAKNRAESLQAMPTNSSSSGGSLAALSEVTNQNGGLGPRPANRFDFWLSQPHPHPRAAIQRHRDNSEGEEEEEEEEEEESAVARNGAKAVRFSDNVETFGHMRTGMDAMKHFGHLSQTEKAFLFLNFTKDGFCAGVRSGSLPDGTPVAELPGQRFRDRYGIVRDRHGPFWPRDYGPLHPTPVHRRLAPPDVEPLFDPIDLSKEPPRTLENQSTPYGARWRGVQIIFDSEKNSRTYTPPPVPEGICPNLTFESRFECGNLRQARRTGQFEYELVLQTDLYTKRHTQWFYFRVHNTVPNITYKFIITNLLKRSSLYGEGMKPLYYSEKEVKLKGIGWYRHGHHIRYSRNVTRMQCPLLQREMIYYQLEWQCEFQHEDDVCYFAHCYPYTYSDLKTDLDLILSDPLRKQVVRKEVLCETRAGNSCFVLTITDNEVKDNDKERQGVVVTARVHPGETNASWMMKGLLDLLTSPCPDATELRQHFVFKIVPMLNPDGVIVGNYRCSLAARDLNRNYRHPRRETFPTVWHTKSMLEDFAKEHPVVLYCDMHGHSRKPNVFMYGCDSQYRNVENVNTFTPKFTREQAQSFLNERLFPWLMSRKAPEMFSFNNCKFNIRKCKEATGRVVMWRQLNIENSFTMEATFSGTTIAKEQARHFNMQDLVSVGEAFGQALLEFIRVNTNREKQAEVVIDMTKTVMQQILESRNIPSSAELPAEPLGSSPSPSAKILPPVSGKERRSPVQPQSSGTPDGKERRLNRLMESVSISSLDNCFQLLEDLKLQDFSESDSSDSDSESEPELPPAPTKVPEKERPKKKKKKLKRKDSELRKLKPKPDRVPAIKGTSVAELSRNFRLKALRRAKPIRAPFPTRKLVPLAPAQLFDSGAKKAPNSDTLSADLKVPENPKKAAAMSSYVSKYEGRSNGGIPCFAEERLLERASKRLLVLQKKNEERRQKDIAVCLDNGDPEPTAQRISGENGLPPTTNSEIDELRRKLNSVLRKAMRRRTGQEENEESSKETADLSLDIGEDDLQELYPLLNDLANNQSSDGEEEEDEETAEALKMDLRPRGAAENKSLMPQLQPSKFQNIRPTPLIPKRRQSLLPSCTGSADLEDGSGHVIYMSNCVKNATGMASAPSVLETKAASNSDLAQRRRLREEVSSRERIANLFLSQKPHLQSLNRR